MALPDPHPGLVVRYSYLWADEYRAGRESGVKDRPCAVVLARQLIEGRVIVTVAAVTHSSPTGETEAIEIPATINRLLGLDDQQSWIIVSEVNDFLWPGPDLVPLPGSDPMRFDYGVLPPGFFRLLREKLMAVVKTQRMARVPRTE